MTIFLQRVEPKDWENAISAAISVELKLKEKTASLLTQEKLSLSLQKGLEEQKKVVELLQMKVEECERATVQKDALIEEQAREIEELKRQKRHWSEEIKTSIELTLILLLLRTPAWEIWKN